MVALPEWAADLGVDGGLLIPSATIVPGEGAEFARTDWWAAAAWYLDGCAERLHEHRHGPIHSYSIRLAGWDARLWEHAWVNRIALFLRRAAARHAGQDERSALGPLPAAEIRLTHDVDAVDKTLRIRIKQGAFDLFNALRAIARGQAAQAAGKIAHGVRFATGPGDYWTVARMCGLEETLGLRSTFNVFAGRASARSWPASLLFDPTYDVSDSAVSRDLRGLARRGWAIGLHQSFDAWQDAAMMREQKARLEDAAQVSVQECRQHWLRFSWAATWPAQAAAGLAVDTTLGFNDRPGFRTGSALRFQPRDGQGRVLSLASLPLVLMDSHLYDYAGPSAADPAAGIARWIGEVRAVAGIATVLWHPHVLSPDYGWADGYEELLRAIA